MAVGSLVLGIISIVLSFIPLVNILGGVIGIIGVVLGALGRKNYETRGMATGGLICSIVGTVLCLIIYVVCVACTTASGTAISCLPGIMN